MMRGGQGGYGSQCQFAAPAPKRVYCRAAPFATVNGNPYQPIVLAYGQSVPQGY